MKAVNSFNKSPGISYLEKNDILASIKSRQDCFSFLFWYLDFYLQKSTSPSIEEIIYLMETWQ
jgi:hypothetical protein